MTALMLAELPSKAGLPDGVCNAVTGTGARRRGAPLVANPAVSGTSYLHRIDRDRSQCDGARRPKPSPR